ncbi:hypothetical protein CAPTEDRAFT_191620 [Capitella teleta]|uniref:Uncharacterized protein n=1 Tax=Capitella teleta TaxID=283909 RepID=R7V274_CAPTE|nr:hypothetical protein CAPTEDRAFT_191620 [Capitella teleta]|eukprot:ELU09791.1 hypothetical protein CAPTEDRAFT_191620 [Capitella teleta]
MQTLIEKNQQWIKIEGAESNRTTVADLHGASVFDKAVHLRIKDWRLGVAPKLNQTNDSVFPCCWTLSIRQVCKNISPTLQSTMNETEFGKFTKDGYFTIRRKDHLWGGIFSDQSIERNLMRLLKTSGGMTRGRGITDSSLAKGYTSFALRHFGNAIVVFDGYETTLSTKTTKRNRRMAKGISREIIFDGTMTTTVSQESFLANRDNKSRLIGLLCDLCKDLDVGTFQTDSNADATIVQTALTHSTDGQFVVIGNDTDLLVMMVALVTPSMNVVYICDTTMGPRVFSIRAIQRSIGEMTSYHLSSQLCTAKGNPAPTAWKTSDAEMCAASEPGFADINIDWPIVADSSVNCDRSLEIGMVAASALDNQLYSEIKLRRTDRVKSIGSSTNTSQDPRTTHCAEPYAPVQSNNIGYTSFALRHFGNAIVVFDGYETTLSTKTTKRNRRMAKGISREIIFDGTMTTTVSQESFLANRDNKSRLIGLLCDLCKDLDVGTFQTDSNADATIVQTALTHSTDGQFVVIGNDTDLLVMMVALVTPSMNVVYICDTTMGPRVFSIRAIQRSIGEMTSYHLSSQLCTAKQRVPVNQRRVNTPDRTAWLLKLRRFLETKRSVPGNRAIDMRHICCTYLAEAAHKDMLLSQNADSDDAGFVCRVFTPLRYLD